MIDNIIEKAFLKDLEKADEECEKVCNKILQSFKKNAEEMLKKMQVDFYDTLRLFLYEHFDNAKLALYQAVENQLLYPNICREKISEYPFRALFKRFEKENLKLMREDCIAHLQERILSLEKDLKFQKDWRKMDL